MSSLRGGPDFSKIMAILNLIYPAYAQVPDNIQEAYV